MRRHFMLPATLAFFLASCGYLESNPKVELEQQWLQQDAQLQAVVEQIRTQGIATVQQSAEAGTLAACVAQRLSVDPVGALINVEGALVESAKVAQLLADVNNILQQEISIDQLASVLQQGADAAAYAQSLIESQGVEQALATLKTMVTQSQQFAQQDLGAHFKTVLNDCKQQTAQANTSAETPAAASTEPTPTKNDANTN
jgi:ribosomal protein S16